MLLHLYDVNQLWADIVIYWDCRQKKRENGSISLFRWKDQRDIFDTEGIFSVLGFPKWCYKMIAEI